MPRVNNISLIFNHIIIVYANVIFINGVMARSTSSVFILLVMVSKVRWSPGLRATVLPAGKAGRGNLAPSA